MALPIHCSTNLRVTTKIGNGGYSSVFKCKNKYNVELACKILPKSTNKLTDVQNEIDVMKRLSTCPKTVQLIDYGQDQSSFYIIQELCKGGDINNFMGLCKSLPERSVSKIINDVCIGLAYMHDQGIIHRDIKESNILINVPSDSEMTVKIGDFGLSVKSNLGISKSNGVKGTAYYMAPENLMRTYYLKSDIWSLGVMTYKLLSGKYPFNDKNNSKQPTKEAIWRSIYNDSVNMNDKEWNVISEEAKDFVKSCLQHNTSQRMNIDQCLQHPWLLYNKNKYDNMLHTNIFLSPL